MLEKLVNTLVTDGEVIRGSIAGSVTESIVHPRSGKIFAIKFARALFVGWALAMFISPAIANRLELDKTESVAVAFIGGYAGIKIISAAEDVLLNKIKKQTKE